MRMEIIINCYCENRLYHCSRKRKPSAESAVHSHQGVRLKGIVMIYIISIYHPGQVDDELTNLVEREHQAFDSL